MPLNVTHLHAKQRGATHSASYDCVRSWFQTEQGKAWEAEKKKLFRADDQSSDDQGDAQVGGGDQETRERAKKRKRC